MALPSDLIDLLAEFDATSVEYLLVGGQAVALHGAPRFTKDADLWLRDTPANIERATEAPHRQLERCPTFRHAGRGPVGSWSMLSENRTAE